MTKNPTPKDHVRVRSISFSQRQVTGRLDKLLPKYEVKNLSQTGTLDTHGFLFDQRTQEPIIGESYKT